jgi:hypothetical protein
VLRQTWSRREGNTLTVAGYTATGLDVSRQILERIDCPNRRLIEADPRLESYPTVKDLAGLPRVVQARKKSQ